MKGARNLGRVALVETVEVTLNHALNGSNVVCYEIGFRCLFLVASRRKYAKSIRRSTEKNLLHDSLAGADAAQCAKATQAIVSEPA